MTDVTDKERETHLRRRCARRDLILRRSRFRDPRSMNFGLYYVAPRVFGIPLTTTGSRDRSMGDSPYRWTLDDVEAYLNGEPHWVEVKYCVRGKRPSKTQQFDWNGWLNQFLADGSPDRGRVSKKRPPVRGDRRPQ